MGDQLRFSDLGESARAFFPELKWGMFVTGGVSSLLPALAGLQNAREMMFLGERYDAKTLLAKGVAWRVVPDAELMTEAQAVAEKLLAQSQTLGAGYEAGAQ